MTFEELKNKILEQIKGKRWTLYGFDKQDEVSFGEISKLVQAELSNLPRQYFSYHTNNKHMTVYFETWVAQKQIKYPLFDLDVKTTRGEVTYSYYGKKTYDYTVSDLVITPITDYSTYADREHPDTITFVDFVIDLAKRDAARYNGYKAKAISALQAISDTLGTKDWTELSLMLRYMRDNFSCLYEEGKINQ